ncbi:MAG: glyoxalase [Bacteroidota bacterium]
MPDLLPVMENNPNNLLSAIFVTFSGNCKKALTFYQTCFGGLLRFEAFEEDLEGFTEQPIVSGSLVSDRIVIHGSDLVHNEGRKLGNYISVFLSCNNAAERKELADKLKSGKKTFADISDYDQKLLEITDAFDVRWVLAV